MIHFKAFTPTMVIKGPDSFTCKFINMNPRFVHLNGFGINNIFFVYF